MKISFAKFKFWQRFKFLKNATRFINIGVSLYREKACQKSAGSLTYLTLFAIVPVMTVTYSMFSIIPAFKVLGDQFQAFIFSHLLPSSEQMIATYIKEFSHQARKLTAVGVIFLLASAYFMLKNIEKNFNAIWNVSVGRKGLSNFLLYWAVLSLGPLLLGVAMLMNTYLMSLKLFFDHYDSLDFMDEVFEWLPWMLTGSAFTLLFAAVPNYKVRLSHAALGGFLTMLVFECLKGIFGWMVKHSSLKLIYGAFAAVPLFLMWINLSWMVILGGAVFVRTIGLYQIGQKDRNYPDFFAGLMVLWQFHQASQTGAAIANRELLKLGLSADQSQRLREALIDARVICLTQQNDYVLSRDLDNLSLLELKQILGVQPSLPQEQTALNDIPWYETGKVRLNSLAIAEKEHLGVTVAAFFGGPVSKLQ